MPEGPVFELRRYRLKRGRRDDLIELFEREFIESQIATGMTLHGMYRDCDDPDAFVWVRSFPDMPSRARSLAEFYGGPVWKAFGATANDTMINSDNVLLLHSAGQPPFTAARSADGGKPLVTVTTYSLAPRREDEFVTFFGNYVAPLMQRAGARSDACFVTERSENTFPRLPVREGETVCVQVDAFESAHAYAVFKADLADSTEWVSDVQPRLDQFVWRQPETMQLLPTRRSAHVW
ncbi:MULTISPECIES: NIPSNAP family protein [Rhizobium/Agrobacterium group]|uniref:NIPSNAP family protein n=2 Tax=Neorhizobium TaxID=1525371 RepID=A0ABV0M2X2_9HYPH|nr:MULTISPECIES: NIPSNAP family protein [Rhizobium/Agrobacterium group]KGD96654.1 hypothetical protein JL39_18910 [Rhizobium sp. YS-1r]MCC2612101.1 NIPSNAP family protein [Neorhizobium petrolearium]WGI67257.1 NIPSNAP family protein [Neorhizobium petrolearium]